MLKLRLFLMAWSSLSFASCLYDGSIIDPSLKESRIPLATFQGKVYFNNDSVHIKEDLRIAHIEHPRIAMVWQFIGPKEFTFAPTEAKVELELPFRFSIELRDPPPEEILASPDLAIGTFWLYADGNQNGELDRLMHPDMLSMNQTVDELYDGYSKAMEKVLAVAEVKLDPVDVSETYYIGDYGTTIRILDGKPDTLFTGNKQYDIRDEIWISVLNNRFRVLSHPNRWERFFNLRKRDNDYYRILRPAAGYAFAYEFPYKRRLFPKPGKELAFEAAVREATYLSIFFGFSYRNMLNSGITQGWTEFPYSGYGKPGVDWVAARTRTQCVLYLRNQSAFDELWRAEKTSSFSVTGKDKLHLGYNLISCTGQYECKVIDQGDSIRLDPGASDSYFNPPSISSKAPILNPVSKFISLNYLQKLQGAYRFQPFHPFCLVYEQGSFWASIPQIGTFRMSTVDSLHFFTLASDLQVQIVSEGGEIEKLLVYDGSKRYVATQDSTSSIPVVVREKIKRLASQTRIESPQSNLVAFSGKYDFGGDTLVISERSNGDSLRVSVPGMAPHFYQPSGEGLFFSPYCDCNIEFHRNVQGLVTGLLFEKEGKGSWVPSLDYKPRSPLVLFPELAALEPDSQVSGSEGSFRDTYAGVDGKNRYTGSSDGRYLSRGDGWVIRLDHSLPGDSITLSAHGEGLTIQIPKLAATAARIEFILRKERATKKGRICLKLVGGKDINHLNDVLAEDFLLSLNSDSTTLVLGAFPLPFETYFLKLERVQTADLSVGFAVDSYRIFVNRLPHADP